MHFKDHQHHAKRWLFREKKRLVKALLGCQVMADRNRRKSVLRELRIEIKETIRYIGADRHDVENRILNHSQSLELLELYKKIYEEGNIEYNPQSTRQNNLKLSGVVQVENGYLCLRNKIYQQAFDSDWVKAKLEVKGRDRIILLFTLLLF